MNIEYTYSACGPFTNNKEKIKKFKETREPRYIYQNELHKAFVQHDLSFKDLKDFKDLIRKIASDKILSDTAFSIAKNPQYDGYQQGPCYDRL